MSEVLGEFGEKLINRGGVVSDTNRDGMRGNDVLIGKRSFPARSMIVEDAAASWRLPRLLAFMSLTWFRELGPRVSWRTVP